MKRILSALFLSVLCCGCSTGIRLKEISPEARSSYFTADLSAKALNGSTGNLLSNFQLMETFKNEPEVLLSRLEQLFDRYHAPEIIAALADAALQTGYNRKSDHPDNRSRYFLAAAFYSGIYLKYVDNEKDLYNEVRIRMIRIHNLAVTELFCYLKDRDLERSSGYELVMPGVNIRKVNFARPFFDLPFAEKDVADFSVCADYRTVNFTHESKEFGLGVPLIATLREDCKDQVGVPLPGIPVPVTLVSDFRFDKNTGKIVCTLNYLYSRTRDTVTLGDRTFPLAADFSTPLAKAAALPQKLNFLQRTVNVQEASGITGLYLFEPYDDKRIPVVFVHGLMSDIKTWGQMLNTLLHDREIRKKYQFMGFAYSSGNPVLVSGAALRNSLAALRKTLVEQKRSTETFDKMVLVGHSMGGLLSRLQISSCSIQHVKDVIGIKEDLGIAEKLSGKEQEMLKNNLEFAPAPFIKRVIFIAVPHRGSEIARSWIGATGAYFIRLPLDLVKLNVRILTALQKSGKSKLKVLSGNTGIDNLRPDAPVLNLLNTLKMADIPYHSIMGNNKKAFTPGGTDGVVPYWSSHLNNAVSELIVHSNHSAHRSPLAIQEVRQILRTHAGIKNFTVKDTHIKQNRKAKDNNNGKN